MKFKNLTRGMGIGGWLTNYKRFNVLPLEWRLPITIGDLEHFETYITKNDIDYIASLGMDHIRLGFDQIVIEEKPGTYRECTLKHIDNFISWCEEANVYPILNLHKAVGNYCDIQEEVTLFDSEALQQRFIDLWVMLEKRYHDKPDIAFELLNEVREIPPEQWNDLAERTIRAIRELNKDRVIVIGGCHWGSCRCLKDLRIFDDENVVYTFHFYDPHEFTHQRGVLMYRPLYYNRHMPYPCDDIERYRDYQRLIFNTENPLPDYERIDKKFLRDLIEPAFEWIRQHPDKILWLGEFGTIRHAKLEWRINYMQDVISFAKEMGISYCVWNYLSTPNDGNRFSLVDDDNRKILDMRLLGYQA